MQFAMGAVLVSFLPIDLQTESELLYCKLPLYFLLSSSFFAMKVLSGLSEQRKSLTEMRWCAFFATNELKTALLRQIVLVFRGVCSWLC